MKNKNIVKVDCLREKVDHALSVLDSEIKQNLDEISNIDDILSNHSLFQDREKLKSRKDFFMNNVVICGRIKEILSR